MQAIDMVGFKNTTCSVDNYLYLKPIWGIEDFKPHPIKKRIVDIEYLFQKYASKWKEETKGLSSITAKSMNPSYQAIIAMGPIVIPFIFKELENKPNDWFWALRFLCNADPIKPEDAGDIDKMTNAWLLWGRNNGYL